MKKETATIEKRPSKGGGGHWVIRDTSSGQFTEVRSTAKSKHSITQAAGKNSELLDRLAKR